VVGEPILNLACKYALNLIRKEDTDRFFSQIQLGVCTPGGVELALHKIQTAINNDPDSVVLHVDLKNAFNMRSRPAILRELYDQPSFAPVWRLAHFLLKDSSVNWLLIEDDLTKIITGQGVSQGNALSMFLFAVSIQAMLKDIAEEYDDVKVVAVVDDIHLVGPAESVFAAFDDLQKRCDEEGIVINKAKTVLLIPKEEGKRDASYAVARGLPDARFGAMRSLGAPIGIGEAYEDLARMQCDTVLGIHGRFFSTLEHPLLPSQEAAMIYRMSVVPRSTT
jgi:hypothetical protein